MTFFDKNKFNMACNETIEIIMHMEDEMKEKIPQKLITFFNKNKIKVAFFLLLFMCFSSLLFNCF